ncbi:MULTISPECIES: hypothetical protein [unclassified Kitasatospora]|uniref:hypothetical protein n=1 Tax=unclassified Kitasatospora TaxID=2633591 RepID=UPI00070B8774|nr:MULTISPECIES: hypothetical protein [unclassified Kitasatospora]KQV20087.1 hypothetical protein ASC99_22115 [Kitasatospora sp. Root107]KRB71184.1 hypothetical protein ASE03_24445 [Kitasatospora sp. Root187]
MTALCRYTLARLLHSQRYLPPVLIFLALVTVLTSSDSGPLTSAYGVCAGAMFLSACWLTVSVVNLDEPQARAIAVVSTGRARRLFVADALVALGICLLLTVVGLVYPLIVGQHTVQGMQLLVGAAAQSAAAFTGCALGLVCSRPVVGRPGYSLLAALGSALVLPLVPGLPPLNPLLTLLAGRHPAAELVWPVGGLAVLGAVLTVVAVLVTDFAAARRE